MSLVSFSVISWIRSSLHLQFKPAFFIVLVVSLYLFSSAAAEAHPATGIVVDRNGNVYFSDLETIWKLDAKGNKTVFRAGVDGRHVHELAMDEEGNIYGADVSYNQATKGWPGSIWRMTPDGALTYLLETTEHPPRGMSIWRDRAGNMYLVDQNNHTKTRTLLLRRGVDGKVTTFAGSAYGHKDGRGTEANFGSVGAMAFGPDGSLYLTDSASVRRVSMAGDVVTVAKDLNFKTNEDRSTLSGGAYGSLAGLAVDANGNVYVADAGNRRLLKITAGGKVQVVYRVEPPFFPNGVFATPAGDTYVLEFGFALPSSWSGPRVRKLSGVKNEIVAAVGADAPSGIKAAVAEQAGSTAESVIEFFYLGGVTRVVVILGSLGLIVSTLVIWKREAKGAPHMKRVWKVMRWVTVVAACLLVAAQFASPARTNPEADHSLALQSHVQVNPQVAALINRSCADCHSNKTRWPWYSKVAPVSWLVIDHVNHGRSHLNFSEWGRYNQREAGEMLGQICKEVKSGAMPLSSYTPLHPGSKLSAADVKLLCDWTNAERERIAAR